jgi:uncharacterized membrane protein YhaH (DUF805 family)
LLSATNRLHAAPSAGSYHERGDFLMWILNIVVLIVLGMLGIAALLRTRRPELDGPVKKLEAVEGWVGIVGLIWGVLSLLQWLSVARA